MDQTLRALTEILQQAVLTVVLFLFLVIYLNAVLFKPLRRILKQRHELTEGARKAAQQSLSAAESKTADYEAKLRDARTEIYREQEELRRQWVSDQTEQIADARARTGEQIRKAKEQLAAETAAARRALEASAGSLADEIASQVLAVRAGGEHA